MLRRVLSLALSLAMVLCAIPIASAAGATGRISGVAMSSNGEYSRGSGRAFAQPRSAARSLP